ncbi:MAG: hypothetical protein ACLTSL_08310 [Odoribacter splanchnicus]
MMKTRFFSFALIGLLVMAGIRVSAQTSKEAMQPQKEVNKLSKEQLNAKASKDARKAAKQYQKEGWTVTPGALPIEKQLDKAYLMQYEMDQYGYPKYLMAEGMSIGESYDAARFQAAEMATLNLAGEIQREITELIDNSRANKQLAAEEAASLIESVGAGKTLISQSIGRTIRVVEMYRTLKNKNKEVMIRIAYNSEMAKEAAKNALRDELEKKSEDLHKKLEKILSGK